MTVNWQPRQLWQTPSGDVVWNAFLSHLDREIMLEGGAKAVFRKGDPLVSSDAVATVDIDGIRLLLAFKEFPFQSLFQAELSISDIPRLPLALANAIIDGMAGTVRGLIPDPWRSRLVLGNTGDRNGQPITLDPTRWEWFDIEIGDKAGPILLTAGCELSRLISFLQKEHVNRPSFSNGLRTRISLSVYLTVGSLSLPLSQLEALREGTLVVMPAASPGLATIRGLESLYTFRKDDKTWKCVGVEAARKKSGSQAPPQGEFHMTAETLSPEAAILRRQDIPVTIDFDLKQVSIALSELEEWRPGSVVALDEIATDDAVAVTVRANGAVVGMGDLVRIDDRLAVRITRLLLAP